MAVTTTDITNRALQLIGTRTTIASLAESSNEAVQANLVFTAIRDWCLGAVNWNFARKTLKLTLLKQVANPPVAPWASASVSPPWMFEYQFPVDALKIQYVTNSDINVGSTAWIGEPKRFVVAIDTITAVEQRVILTNEGSAVAVYTQAVTDPTEWPWMFERFMVAALAWTLAPTLSSDKELTQYLDGVMMRFFEIGTNANQNEGLAVSDNTTEWIQALGMNYQFRRNLGKDQSTPRGQPNDNRR